MSWTDPQAEMSEGDKLAEKLNKLPMRDHVSVVATMTFMQLFEFDKSADPSLVKDLSYALYRSIKHVSSCDTLKFLMEQLEKAPEATTIKDVLIVLAMMGLKSQEKADEALRDAQRLTALLPSELERSNAR